MNLSRSPAKKQLLVSLAVSSAATPTTTTTVGSNSSLGNLNLNQRPINTTEAVNTSANKSVENIYDKVNDNQVDLRSPPMFRIDSHDLMFIYQKKINTLKNEELAAEMALEGVMNDLKAITAQQFEC